MKMPSSSGQNPNGEDVGDGGGRFAEKIESCFRKSRVGLGLGFLPKLASPPSLPPPPPPPLAKDSDPAIKWRRGELIGCGTFGHVYMGMNLDSGELLAVKQGVVYWQPRKQALEKVKQKVWEPSTSHYGADEGLPELSYNTEGWVHISSHRSPVPAVKYLTNLPLIRIILEEVPIIEEPFIT